MNILLDTCTFIWILKTPEHISLSAKELHENKANTVYLSVISEWEMMLIQQKHPATFTGDIGEILTEKRIQHDVELLILDEPSVAQFSRVPLLHKDPFDRMLIAQAITHDLTILTPDKEIQKYDVKTLW